MRVNVLMEIDPGKGQMWIRLYDQDAEALRDFLVPGSRVAISGIVSVYEASGGYPVEEPPRGDDDLHDPPDLGEVVRTDRFQLNSGSLELVVHVEGCAVSPESIKEQGGEHDGGK